MIIINLKGGTGNQLFQYAFGRYLALRNNDMLKFDTGGLARANEVGDIYRPFSLSPFLVVGEVASAEEVRHLKYPYGLLSKIWRFLAFKLSPDKNVLFKPSRVNKKGNIYLDGYWQSPLYFDSIRSTLLKELSLKGPLSPGAETYARAIKDTESVSLHVRRADYVKNPQTQKEYGSCTLTYYEAAVAKIKSSVTNPAFFVFSDDIDWVKDNLKINAPVTYVKDANITDTEELTLMSFCKHNIIANSSFSWWGAWLNPNPEKMVIAPTPWFNTTIYDKTLLPPTWIQLPK